MRQRYRSYLHKCEYFLRLGDYYNCNGRGHAECSFCHGTGKNDKKTIEVLRHEEQTH